MSTNINISPVGLGFLGVASVACGVVMNHFGRLYVEMTAAGQNILEALNGGLSGCIPDLLAHPLVFSMDSFSRCMTLVGVCIPWLAAYYLFTSRGNYRPGEEHGSARWMTPREMKLFGDWDDLDNNIILSRNARMVMKAANFNLERDRNKNVLIIGGPGSGKTRYFVKPNLMQLNSNVWVTDPKGMLPQEVGQMYLDAGYDLRVFNTIDFNLSMHFNPFAYVSAVEDIPPLVDCLVNNVKPPDSGHSGDPFWEQSEKQLLVALIAYMFEALPFKDVSGKEVRTFRTLNKLLGMIEISEKDENLKSPLDILFEAWETGVAPSALYSTKVSDAQREFIQAGFVQGTPHPDSYAVMEYRKFKVGAGKTLKSILMSVNADLWQFDLPAVLELTDYDEMDLDSLGGLIDEDLMERAKTDPGILNPGMGAPCGKTKHAPNGQRKTALFVAMEDQNTTYNFLIAVLTYLGINRLKNYADNRGGGKLPIPMQFYLDEFANIGKINDFQNVITTIRSRNMAATCVIQSLSQLDSVYGKEEASTIKDGCATWIYIGSCGDETCETISKVIGNSTVNNRNTSKTYAEKNSGSVSEQIVQRQLIDPAEVRKLNPWKCIVMITGVNAFLDDKYLIEEHPRYHMIDPGHKAGKSHKGKKFPAADYDEPFDVRSWRAREQAKKLWAESGGVRWQSRADAANMEDVIGNGIANALVDQFLTRRTDAEVDEYLSGLGT